MIDNVDKARIVITHGGPSSFIMAQQIGKIPIVVPRMKALGEHINDHQIVFCRQAAARQRNIIVVEDINKLGEVIEHYDETILSMKNSLVSNNEKFCAQFGEIVDKLFD